MPWCVMTLKVRHCERESAIPDRLFVIVRHVEHLLEMNGTELNLQPIRIYYVVMDYPK